MTKSLAEQLARFGFKAKPAAAIEAPEGFDEETTAPVVEETQAKEVKPTEAVEAEAPKAEVSEAETVKEAPKTEETVAEATPAPVDAPAQVETPVVAAVEAAPTTSAKKLPRSISRMRITNETTGIDITQIGEVKPISNRGLRKFREDTFGKNSLDDVPDEYVIDGTLSKSSGVPCVWEEGGADMASGYALLVADKNGNKKEPVLCLRDQGIVNGKHALVPVTSGDLILLGVMKQSHGETQVCCVIGTVTEIAAEAKRALITMSPIVCVRNCGPDAGLELQYANDSLAFIDENHPLLQAALVRVQEKFCREPIYVRDYIKYTFNKVINDDLNMAFEDAKFVQSLQVFNTTDEAYNELEKVIGDKVATASKHESVLVTTGLNINRDSQGNDCIFIYIVGCVFNNANNSSQGGRFFYGRTKILPGQTFTYIDDRESPLVYECALEQMTLRGKKWIADSVKRVTV